MKTLILIILLALLAGLTFAQTEGKLTGGGVVWTDSLGYNNLAVEGSDSVLIINMNFAHSWYKIIVDGNANSQVDSFYVQSGTVRYSQGGAAVDTMWGSWMAVKDSAWGDINTMINNTVGKDFLLFSPVVQLLKFSLLNERDVTVYDGALVPRNCVITIQAVKP